MRKRILPFNMWISLLISAMIAGGAVFFMKPVLQQKNAEKERIINEKRETIKNNVSLEEIGAVAGDELLTVSTIQELKELAEGMRFTIETKKRDLIINDFENPYFLVELPSGENVLAKIFTESEVRITDTVSSVSKIRLPVGIVVKEAFTNEKLDEMGKKGISRIDDLSFYVDMYGEQDAPEIVSESEKSGTGIFVSVYFITFIIVRLLYYFVVRELFESAA